MVLRKRKLVGLRNYNAPFHGVCAFYGTRFGYSRGSRCGCEAEAPSYDGKPAALRKLLASAASARTTTSARTVTLCQGSVAVAHFHLPSAAEPAWAMARKEKKRNKLLVLAGPLNYGVATISRLLKITGFFCKRAL